MDRSPKFEIADEGDVEVVDFSLAFADREEIDESLGRVLVGAVARIDHRLVARLGGQSRRTVERMADGEDVGIRADHPDRIEERFSLSK